MARDHARVNVTIWGDPDWRLLPPAAQHLYMALWSSPDLTYCGTHDWRPARMNGLWAGFTVDNVRTVAACLQARHFLVIDEGTEEALIRSWARFDGLMKQPRMAVSLVNAYASVASGNIRAILVHELHKIRKESSELACWQDRRVAEVLDHPAVSAKDLPTPDDPFGAEVASGLALGLPQTQGGVWGSVYTPPTPAPAPAPKPSVVQGGVGGGDSAPKSASRKRPAKALPDDWQPTDEHRRRCADERIDIDRAVAKFKAHAEANDRRQANWNAAFTQWLLNEKPSVATPAPRHYQRPDELERPPDGLSDEEMSDWLHEQVARRRRA